MCTPKPLIHPDYNSIQAYSFSKYNSLFTRSLILRHSVEASQTTSWLAPASFFAWVSWVLTTAVVCVPFLARRNVGFGIAPFCVIIPFIPQFGKRVEWWTIRYKKGVRKTKSKDDDIKRKKDVLPLWLVWFQWKKHIPYVPETPANGEDPWKQP